MLTSESPSNIPLTSPPNSYVSLFDTLESSDALSLSLSERSPFSWSRRWDTVRQWSWRTFKSTRLFFQERFGHVQRTQDIQIEQQIQLLNETKVHYDRILLDARQMSIHFAALIQCQRSLGQSLNDIQRLSGSSDDLVDQIVRNSLCHKTLANNGETLLNSLKTFVDKLQTLTSKTIEDTLNSVKTYENARMEFDVSRSDYEPLLNRSSTNGISTVALSPAEEDIQRRYQHFQRRYEKAKDDLTIKLQLLDENRIETMRQQLLNLHSAIVGYFSVNRQQLNL